MKTYYKNDLKQAYLILEGDEKSQDDYQLVMLKENEIAGILKTEARYIDNQCHYYYDISGKTSFKMLHEKVNISCDDMKRLVTELLQVIWNLQRYMLDGNCILLDPEYIFCDKEHYFFCYYPFLEQKSADEFHRLTEFFVREVNYKDEEGVHFAYMLHKATMEENYSIEQIMQELLPVQKEEEAVVNYVTQMEQREEEENFVEEKNDIWQRMRRFFERARSRYWDDEEEDL